MFYMKYHEMKLIAGVSLLWSLNDRNEISFWMIKCYENTTWNKIIRKKTSAYANIKEIYYLNCCCGIRTSIKSALRQRRRICVYQCFQMNRAKVHIFRYRFTNGTYEKMLLVNAEKGEGWFDSPFPLPPPCGFSKSVFFRERMTPWFFVTFSIIISHILPENSIEINQSY